VQRSSDNMQVKIKKYKKEIKSILSQCQYDKSMTKFLEKDTLLDRQLLVIKRQEHNKFNTPFLVLWIGIITDTGLQLTDGDGKTLALAIGLSKYNLNFYKKVRVGDIFTIGIFHTGNLTGHSYKVVNYGSRRNAGFAEGV